MRINWKSRAEKAERELARTTQQLNGILRSASQLSGENDKLKKRNSALMDALALQSIARLSAAKKAQLRRILGELTA